MTLDEAFRLLGLTRYTDAAAINQAWRRAAAIHHPDRGGNEAYMRDLNVARDLALAARPDFTTLSTPDPASDDLLQQMHRFAEKINRDRAAHEESIKRREAMEALDRRLKAWLRRHPAERAALEVAIPPPERFGATSYSIEPPEGREAMWQRHLRRVAVFEQFKQRGRPVRRPIIRSPGT